MRHPNRSPYMVIQDDMLICVICIISYECDKCAMGSCRCMWHPLAAPTNLCASSLADLDDMSSLAFAIILHRCLTHIYDEQILSCEGRNQQPARPILPHVNLGKSIPSGARFWGPVKPKVVPFFCFNLDKKWGSTFGTHGSPKMGVKTRRFFCLPVTANLPPDFLFYLHGGLWQ